MILRLSCFFTLVYHAHPLTTSQHPVDTPRTTATSDHRMSRRIFAYAFASVPVFIAASPVHAFKGAAQLDAEFYVKRLLDGNKPQDAKVPQSPVTRVDPDFIRQLEAAYYETLSRASGKPQAFLRERFAKMMEIYEPVFQRQGPFMADDLTNSRAVNLRVYTWWKLVGEVLKTDRREFAAAFGERILEEVCVGDEAFSRQLAVRPMTVERALGGVARLLDRLQGFGLLKSFSVKVDEDAQDDWAHGDSVDVQLSLSNPVALVASVQLSQEARPIDAPGTQVMEPIDRFRPDLATLGLLAVFKRCGVYADFDEYFFDETYREDPNDTQPTVLLQQWSLAPPGDK
mmetsp:Transcript_37544/g.74308  ORF Transcript_37544/g.74308 Transcript_37544/m.74308 type:complete len:343 (+) Transcript_37544:73-1101(+)